MNSKKGITVAKFGGSSLRDQDAISRSVIIAANRNASIVVVSATEGTTNQLVKLIDLLRQNSEKSALIEYEKIKHRHLGLARLLELNREYFKQIENSLNELKTVIRGVSLLKDCSLKNCDRILSFGEILSSLLFVGTLEKVANQNCHLFNIQQILKTDDNFSNAAPNYSTIATLSNEILVPLLGDGQIIVTQGFTGSSPSNSTTTLGRGGSDLTASILAWATNSKILEIWTDVPGIKTLDPRLHSRVEEIDQLTYTEASELASFGAKIIHPATLSPVVKKKIPVYIGSSFDELLPGTWIVDKCLNPPLIRALALKENQILLTITTPQMWHTHGMLYKIFKIFHNYKVSVDSITTSEISVALTLDDSTLLNQYLLDDLSSIGQVQVERDLSVISLIGNGINYRPGIAAKIFGEIQDINVRMICHGASMHNFCFLVDKNRAQEAIIKLHEIFIEQRDLDLSYTVGPKHNKRNIEESFNITVN